MNANKQDVGGEVTNPDNVGGLPELPEPIRMGLNDAIPFGGYYTADQMRAYGELCRAAPAGSGEVEDQIREALRGVRDLEDGVTAIAALLRKLQQGAE